MTGGPDLDPRLFDGSLAAVAVLTGPEGRLVYANQSFTRLFGPRPLGRPAPETFPDPDAYRFLAVLDEVRATGQARQVVGARRTDPGVDGQADHFVYSCSPVTTADGDGILVVALDTTPETWTLQRYQALISAISQMVWVMHSDGSMEELVPGWEQLTGVPWHPRADEEWYAHIHPRDRENLSRMWRAAAKADAPKVFEAVFRVQAADGSYRHLATRSVPVLRDGRIAEWVSATADVEHSWETRLRERLLAQVAGVSGSGLQGAFGELVKVIVPELTDACLILLLSHDEWPLPDNATVSARRVASATRPGLPAPPAMRGQSVPLSPLVREILEQRQPRTFLLPPGGPVPPGLVPAVTERWLAAADSTSITLIPLVVDETVLGYAVTGTSGDSPVPDDSEIELLREVLHHAQRPIRKALDLQQARRTALGLQRTHLTEPPRVPGAALAARYQPASSTGEIGGDWYDAFALADGTLILDIGDVAGHDLTAATAMGQMRSMLRTLAYAGGPGTTPSAVLARLDEVAEGLSTAPLATAIHATLRPRSDGDWELSWSSAGHPAPLLIPARGDAHFLSDAPDLPLCVDPRVPRTTHTHLLRPGDTLLLYTDGLVETPFEALDDRLRQLAREATLCQDRATPELLKTLEGLSDLRDDIAMIAFRTDTNGGPPGRTTQEGT
ncbi:SpoIIE family protein phosphatase [Streptomyces sp. NPDC048002]|uniref:SpoIIE family protein phosphatase n=1 Tax=Streptomyces sp. NPDC048002 TaxID=3154344 RepID=UPI0033F41565